MQFDRIAAFSGPQLCVRVATVCVLTVLGRPQSDKETLVKLHGRGPEAIEQAAVRAFFRYDSSARELRPLSRGPSFGAAHAVAIAPPQPRPSSAGSG